MPIKLNSHSGSMYHAPLMLRVVTARRASPLLSNFRAVSRSPQVCGTIDLSHMETGLSVPMSRSNRIRNISVHLLAHVSLPGNWPSRIFLEKAPPFAGGALLSGVLTLRDLWTYHPCAEPSETPKVPAG